MGRLFFQPSILLSSFLLFLVQPLVSKCFLPVLGGAPAVWTSCLVFFQIVLLLGYVFPYLVSRWIRPREYLLIHAFLVIAAAVTLPWKVPSVQPSHAPEFQILEVLFRSVGFPFFVLSTTSPLLQYWHAISNPDSSPYRLYALSNLGSFVALLSFPILVEPNFSLTGEYVGWAGLFVVFSIVMICLCLCLRGDPAIAAHSPKAAATGTPWPDLPVWTLFSGLGCVIFLGGTNHITQNIASVPLLWVVPLALYLVTYILSFGSVRPYRRPLWMSLFTAGIILSLSLPAQLLGASGLIASNLSVIFSGCMILNGELALRKPHPENLTVFYSALSLGGALGGIFVGYVAPRVFSSDIEYHLAWCAISAILAGDILGKFRLSSAGRSAVGFGTFGLLSALILTFGHSPETIREERNFFGTVKILIHTDPTSGARSKQMIHGGVVHGMQYVDKERENVPTTYFGPGSGADALFTKVVSASSRKVGIIGLGAGTMLSYLKGGDSVRIYEIDSKVVRIAGEDFTFVESARNRGVRVEIIDGDGRISLQSELPNQFDLLIIDAFSGDAIPIHLLTKEALLLYSSHLKDGGVLAFHISNNFLSLERVLAKIAPEVGMAGGIITDSPSAPDQFPSTYAILSKNEACLAPIREHLISFDEIDTPSRSWTDQYSNILGIARWR